MSSGGKATHRKAPEQGPQVRGNHLGRSKRCQTGNHGQNLSNGPLKGWGNSQGQISRQILSTFNPPLPRGAFSCPATYGSTSKHTMELFQHAQTFFAVAAGLHGAALVVVNLTKTPKDDEIVAKAYKLIEFAAGIITPRVKK